MPLSERESALDTIENTFVSMLIGAKQSRITKITEALSDFSRCVDVTDLPGDTDSSPPSSDAQSEATLPATASVSTPEPRSNSTGKRKLTESEEELPEDDKDDDKERKRHKQLDDRTVPEVEQDFACPFRKYCPSFYGLKNVRYKVCATNSWSKISHLK